MPPVGPAAQIEVALAHLRVMLRAQASASEAILSPRTDQRMWRTDLAHVRTDLKRIEREMTEALAELTPLPHRVSDSGAAYAATSEFPKVKVNR